MYRSGEAESLLPVFGTILAFGPEELRSCREGLRALREGEVPLAGGGGSTWVREGEIPLAGGARGGGGGGPHRGGGGRVANGERGGTVQGCGRKARFLWRSCLPPTLQPAGALVPPCFACYLSPLSPPSPFFHRQVPLAGAAAAVDASLSGASSMLSSFSAWVPTGWGGGTPAAPASTGT